MYGSAVIFLSVGRIEAQTSVRDKSGVLRKSREQPGCRSAIFAEGSFSVHPVALEGIIGLVTIESSSRGQQDADKNYTERGREAPFFCLLEIPVDRCRKAEANRH